MVKKSMSRVTAVLLTVLMVLALLPTNAYAATKKSVKYLAFTTEKAKVLKKDTVVKKGTNYLTYAKRSGWLTFVAPSTKTYTFTFSNFKCTKKGVSFTTSSAFTSVYVDASYKGYLTSKKVKTAGGSDSTLWHSVNGYKSTTKDKLYRNLPTRTAKVKLKKGQRVYFYTYYGYDAKMTSKLVIK